MTLTLGEETKKEDTGRAIGRIATGVYVVTVNHDGDPDGMLTTWIVQSAFEPPMLSVAVKKERPILASMKKGNQFSVNVLSKKNMDIFKNFAKPYTDGLNRFDGLAIDTSIASGPIFSECVAYMACKVHDLVEAGDHYLVIAEILTGAILHADDEPMTHLRKNGFQY